MELAQHEDAYNEFKQAWSDTAKKTICAFLNGRGGTIWFGVNDEGTPVGLKNAEEVSNAVTNTFRSIHPDASDYYEAKFLHVDGKVILAVIVRPGTETPYKVDIKGEGRRAYVRKGSSTYEATPEEVVELISIGNARPWELRRAPKQDLTFQATREIFDNAALEFSPRVDTILKLRLEENGPYTNLALLLSDQCQAWTRLGYFDGTDKASKITTMQDVRGSILRQYELLYTQLSSNIRFSYEIGERGERVERREFPLAAVREALVNLCVHRDFSIPAAATIAVFSDRMEFLTIGGLPRHCNPAQLRRGISICRNQALCDVFMRLKLMEAWGMGIPIIYKAYEKETVEPTFDCSDDMVCITLPRLQIDTEIPMLSDIARKVLTYLNAHDAATRAELQSALGISYVTIQKVLQQLVDDKLITRLGAGRSTRYQQIER